MGCLFGHHCMNDILMHRSDGGFNEWFTSLLVSSHYFFIFLYISGIYACFYVLLRVFPFSKPCTELKGTYKGFPKIYWLKLMVSCIFLTSTQWFLLIIIIRLWFWLVCKSMLKGHVFILVGWTSVPIFTGIIPCGWKKSVEQTHIPTRWCPPVWNM